MGKVEVVKTAKGQVIEEIIQEIRRKCMSSKRIKESLQMYDLSLDEIEICFLDKPGCRRYILQHGSGRGNLFSVYVDHQLNLDCFHVDPDLLKPFWEKEAADRERHPENYKIQFIGPFHVGSL